MEHAGSTRCIECGGAVGSLNEDEDGIPCPACAERLIETLPGVFHAPWGTGRGAVEPGEPEPSGEIAEGASEEEASATGSVD